MHSPAVRDRGALGGDRGALGGCPRPLSCAPCVCVCVCSMVHVVQQHLALCRQSGARLVPSCAFARVLVWQVSSRGLWFDFEETGADAAKHPVRARAAGAAGSLAAHGRRTRSCCRACLSCLQTVAADCCRLPQRRGPTRDPSRLSHSTRLFRCNMHARHHVTVLPCRPLRRVLQAAR